MPDQTVAESLWSPLWRLPLAGRARMRQLSVMQRDSGGGTRTPDTRIMIPWSTATQARVPLRTPLNRPAFLRQFTFFGCICGCGPVPKGDLKHAQ